MIANVSLIRIFLYVHLQRPPSQVQNPNLHNKLVAFSYVHIPVLQIAVLALSADLLRFVIAS